MLRLLPLPSVQGVDLDDAYWLDDPGRQHVRGVMISSVDGAAQSDGRAGGLAGPADRLLFAALRRQADVLLVGAGTAQAEEYGGVQLTSTERAWRRERGLRDIPPIAVVTRSCSLDPGGPLFTDTHVRPLVLTCRSAPADRVAALTDRADIVICGAEDVDIRAGLAALAERGLRRVSCEGGPTLLAQVVAAGRLSELCLTLSPQLLAGDALRITSGPSLAPAATMHLTHVFHDDGFLFVRYRLPASSTGDSR